MLFSSVSLPRLLGFSSIALVLLLCTTNGFAQVSGDWLPVSATVENGPWGSDLTGRNASTCDRSTAADFDGDGRLEFVTARSSSTGNPLKPALVPVVQILEQNAGSSRPLTLDVRTTIPLPFDADPFAVVAADLDLDGLVDIALSSEATDQLILLRATVGGTFETTIIPVGDAPTILRAEDLNTDGALDLLVVEEEADSLRILGNDGTGGFTTLDVEPVGDTPVDLDLADVDADGDLDVLVAAREQGVVGVFTNDGSGAVSSGAKLLAGGAFSKVEDAIFADTNADGMPDVVLVVNQTPSNLSGFQLFTGAGDGTFTYMGQSDSPPFETSPFRGVGAGDYDEDGALELLINVVGVFGTQLGAYFVDDPFGTGIEYTFFDWPGHRTAAEWVQTDIDLDGDIDVVSWDDINTGTTHVPLVLFRVGAGDIPASFNQRNGNGSNPLVLSGGSPAKLGMNGAWMVDNTVVPGATLATVLGYLNPSTPLSTPFGELLIDPTTPLVLVSSIPLTSCMTCTSSALIPLDTDLVGLTIYSQVGLTGGGPPVLGNALDITIGW